MNMILFSFIFSEMEFDNFDDLRVIFVMIIIISFEVNGNNFSLLILLFFC